MVWWIQVLEIADDQGKGINKFRLTAASDEDGGGPYGLCSHTHNSIEEADICAEARECSKRYF